MIKESLPYDAFALWLSFPHSTLVKLKILQDDIESHTMYKPSAVMLKRDLNPKGPNAPDITGAKILGVPVIWGDYTAVLYEPNN